MLHKNIKVILTMIAFIAITFTASAQKAEKNKSKLVNQTVEASCGQCQFGMKDKKGCDLAVHFDNKSYFVESVKIDEHGDAHAKDGFCNAVRKAKVTGKVVGNKFVAKSFELLPVTDEKK